MKHLALVAILLSSFSCSSVGPGRVPAESIDLSGTYLGEADYKGFLAKTPAVRIYFHRNEEEANSYYAVLLEYSGLLRMAAPYLSSQKAPPLNKVVGYLNNIASRISAYKVVPGSDVNTYKMYSLKVVNGSIQPHPAPSLTLTLSPNKTPGVALAGATITGPHVAPLSFPSPNDQQGVISSIGDLFSLSQLELATFTYKVGKLASTWRGDFDNLSGSYLSQYGLLHDGVLELYAQGNDSKAKFIKTLSTKAKNFTNPKSAPLVGDYIVNEPVREMFVLSPATGGNSASDRELTGRIGLFLDVFDGSAPEAGGHLVVELAFINPENPEDFLMYYEHPEHAKSVGVGGKK